MPDELLAWGTPHTEQDPRALRSDRARGIVAACESHPAFEVLEYRHYTRRDGPCDVVVVRCTNQEVPNRNRVGIRVREVLAVTVPVDDELVPEVRALRAGFPLVPHLNIGLEAEPRWLCLYFEPWSAVRRRWTPQRFVKRILWWLTETARGTLHPQEQPVERVYFNTKCDVVLPADYTPCGSGNTRLAMALVPRGDDWTLVAWKTTAADVTRMQHVAIFLSVERTHGLVASPPRTLGVLIDSWASHGVALAPLIVERLAGLAGGGIIDVDGQCVLLILDIGITRVPGGVVERRDVIGFLIFRSVVSLAYEMGAVYRRDLMYFAASAPDPNAAQDWRPIELHPVDVKMAMTTQAARSQAGLLADGGDAPRVLIGVGSLGSALADIWTREGWGRWTFIDPDYVEPHNLVRHRAVYADLGQQKVNVVKRLTEGVYSPGYLEATAIAVDATARDNEELAAALRAAELVVDVSTTLEVPRDLSARGNVRRMASAFMTPNGSASVLLLEDQDRAVRLHWIESQYYRQILRNPWGANHLVREPGSTVVVGAGCRDVSTVMSPEIVELHAAILARQIRTLSTQPNAALGVWIASDDGGVEAFFAPVRRAICFDSGTWCVVIDEGVIESVRGMRSARLPTETGGVIFGYTDHKSRTIHVVDVFPAPSDSVEDEGGFIRGAEGLAALRSGVLARTGNIVDYIGEWHSHPPRHDAVPSSDDRRLIKHVGDVLAGDGEPALMIIVAEAEVSISIYDAYGRATFASPMPARA